MFLNIEIKDVKGTEYPKFKPSEKHLLSLLAEETRSVKDWVVFSSFAIADLIEMEKLIDDAKLALLFDFPEMKERFIYANRITSYNVCYTKLLRMCVRAASSTFVAAAIARSPMA